MTKKMINLTLGLLLGTTLFLNGCNLSGNTGGNNINLPDNEVVSIIKNFAKEINTDYSNIKETTFSRYNYANINEYYEITGYSVSNSGIKTKDIPSMTDFFDGWIFEYLGDGVGGSFVGYSKDNIICYLGENIEQEIPYDLMDWEGDFENDEYEKARKDFYSKATYFLDLSCGYKLQSAPQFQNLYFNAEGMEPFRSASIRGNSFVRFEPDNIEYYYLDLLNQDKENFSFQGYNIEGNIVKEDCIDGGKGDTHDYKITVFREGDMGYMGCADKIESDFMIGEEGTLGNFVKKTNYQYKGNSKWENISYRVFDIVNNYMEVSIYNNDNNNYSSYELIMEKTDNGRKVLYEGDYEVDDDKCEELLQYDNYLMEMFFFRNCPRG